MKRVLVAGGGGFIGSNLIGELLSRGNVVTCLDNFSTGSIENIHRFLANPNFTLLNEELLDFDPEALEPHDEIYHLASPASPPKYLALAEETMMVNTAGTMILVAAAESWSARLLFASTSEVYGDPLVSPQKEGYWGNVNPIGPRSVYDESKRLGETIVSFHQRERSLDAVIVRIFNTYGPGMDPYDGRVVSSFIRQTLQGEPLTIFGNGLQTRSFCYISDLVDALTRAMSSKILGPVNLGNPNEISLLTLAAKVFSAVGKSVDLEHGNLPVDDPTNRCPDISLAIHSLGWRPSVDLETGLKLTADWITSKLQNLGPAAN